MGKCLFGEYRLDLFEIKFIDKELIEIYRCQLRLHYHRDIDLS